MDNTLNTFAKGMIKDVAETLRPEDSYDDAQDMKLNAGNSASEYIISNVKGNKLSFTIPDIASVIRLGLKDYYNLPGPWLEKIRIVATSGVYVGNVFEGQYNDEDDYFDQIENSLNNDVSFSSLNLNVSRQGNVFRIWSETDNLISIDSAPYPNIRLINTVQQAQANQQIIGWESINESIYLFTTNDSSATGGIGAIFKLDYDTATLDTSIKLIYTENVNFTTANPIANPGGIVGIDETTFTRNIYWTDRLNDLRSINVADPNIMSADPVTLNMNVNIVLKKPILQDILLGGSVVTGHYEFAYSLATASGVETSYSHASNSIYISASNPSYTYQTFHGSDEGEISNNAIRIKIDEIDTSYEYINIIVLKTVSLTSPTEIYKLIRQPITDDVLLYTYTGDEDVSIITEAQFTRVLNIFNKCHTIAKKDNTLFAANTTGIKKELDFDARAYRFDENGDINLNDISGSPLNVTPLQALTSFGMGYDSDAINPDQNIYKYKTDGITLGGEGPNISYEFNQRHFNVDARSNAARFDTEYPTGSQGDYKYPYRLPFSQTSGDTDNLGEDNIYNIGGLWSDFKSPFLSHYQKGYRREETYRFAFVPYKDGAEIYAKWIADIKMPSIWEDWDRYVEEDDLLLGGTPNFGVSNAADTNRIFPLTRFTPGGGPVNCVTLGVKFTVNIPPEIADQIDGFRIKRVKLEPLDRTVVAQGIIHLTHYDKYKEKWYLQGQSRDGNSNDIDKFALNGLRTEITSGGSYAGPLPYAGYIVTPDSSDWIREGTKVFSHPVMSFHSPDFLFGTPVNYFDGDELKVVQGLGMSASTLKEQKNDTDQPAEKTVYHKIYGGAPCFGSEGYTHKINDAQSVSRDGEYLVGNYSFVNQTPYIPNYSGGTSIGAPTTVIALDGNLGIPLEDDCETPNVNGTNYMFAARGYLPAYNYPISEYDEYGDWVSDIWYTGDETRMRPDKFHANYIRKNLGQYGGPGFANRQQNIYINTGTDVVLKENQSSYTIKVYGGDTYVNIFDTLKVSKNYNDDALGMEPAGSLIDNDSLVFSTEAAEWGKKRIAVGLYYPCEAFVNSGMRHGYHINGDNNPAGYMAGSKQEIPNAELFPLDYGEDFKYNFVFSQVMDTQRSFPLPVGQPDVFKHPVRIWASSPKTYGETLDSWRYWDYEKYIDIEGDLGEIRQLITHADQLHAWQENGFGIASVNERAVTTDQSGSGIILGKSGVLPRFDYISEIIGGWHQFSFAVSPLGVLFFDKKDGGLYLYGSQGMKDVSQGKINAWLHENTRGVILQNDGPTGGLAQAGISSTYDYINKEFLITFFDRQPYDESGNPILITIPFTLAYSDVSDVFTSFRSFNPIMYINDNKNMFTPKPFSIPSQAYIHEQGDRGVFYDNPPSTSSITTVVNKEPFITKIFDNIRWLSEIFLPDGTEVSDETFSSIETFNTYQTTGVRTQFRRLMREWKHAIQYQFGTKNRIRSHYVRQKFEFLNNNDKEFRLHYIMNLFRKIMK